MPCSCKLRHVSFNQISFLFNSVLLQNVHEVSFLGGAVGRFSYAHNRSHLTLLGPEIVPTDGIWNY